MYQKLGVMVRIPFLEEQQTWILPTDRTQLMMCLSVATELAASEKKTQMSQLTTAAIY